MALTARVEEWRAGGEQIEFQGRRIYVRRRSGSEPALLLLHGFPSSSYDWRRLLDAMPGRAATAFDFLGFGLSEKPRDHVYSLHGQADLTEEVVRRCAEGESIFLVAHDMGTSVATELMARDLEGRLEASVHGALLFNGSILIERARPTVGQKLLRSPLGPAFSQLTSERFFRRQLGSVFSPEHPLDPDEAADQWALLAHEGGHRIGHRLVHYMGERTTYAERWHGAIRDWAKPLSFLWGMRDPVAVPAVLEGLRELRPSAPVTELSDIGHYPQIEAPVRLAAAIEAAIT